MKRLVSMCLLAVGIAGLALGGGKGHENDAPEINPSLAAGALALLAGGILIIRRKK
jgi:LPXTG-motif cell wall-anchored protein